VGTIHLESPNPTYEVWSVMCRLKASTLARMQSMEATLTHEGEEGKTKVTRDERSAVWTPSFPPFKVGGLNNLSSTTDGTAGGIRS